MSWSFSSINLVSPLTSIFRLAFSDFKVEFSDLSLLYPLVTWLIEIVVTPKINAIAKPKPIITASN